MTREHETQDTMTERVAAEALTRIRAVVEKALGGPLPNDQKAAEPNWEAQDAFKQGWEWAGTAE